jgi:hypothetical protein
MSTIVPPSRAAAPLGPGAGGGQEGAPGPHQREPGWLLLAHAVAGGPGIWMIHLAGSAALVHTACVHDMSWVINLFTALSAVICATSVGAAWYIRHRLVSPVAAYNGRTRGLMFLGLLFGIVSFVLILLEGAPVLFLGACKVA